MKNEMNELKLQFLSELNQFHRKTIRKHLKQVFLSWSPLLFVSASGAAAVFAAGTAIVSADGNEAGSTAGGSFSLSEELLHGTWLFPLCCLIFILLLCLKSLPSRKDCAGEFDRSFRSESRIVNAFEILERNGETPFERYALIQGLNTLRRVRENKEKNPGEDLAEKLTLSGMRWKEAFLLAGGILAFCLCLPFSEKKSAEEGQNPSLASGRDSRPEKTESLSDMENLRKQNSLFFRNRLPLLTEREADIGGKDGLLSRKMEKNSRRQSMGGAPSAETPQAENCSQDHSSSSSSPDSGIPSLKRRQAPPGIPAETNPDIILERLTDHPKKDKTQKRPFPSSSGESSALDGRDEAKLSQSAHNSGNGSLNRPPSGRKQKRRSAKESREIPHEGASIMLSDNAPPASRELGKEEPGKDGTPSPEGRGGESGDKKSRGTASMLPVTPLPDTVNGQLSRGEDISFTERTPPSSKDPLSPEEDSTLIPASANSTGAISSSLFPQIRADEPAGRKRTLPLPFRKLLGKAVPPPQFRNGKAFPGAEYTEERIHKQN